MTYRLRNIAIAVALAVLAAMIVSFYVKQQKEDLQRGQTLTAVYVAKEDIPAGTPGSEIANKVERVEVTKDAAAPGAIVNPSDLEGKVATEQIYANEQVSLLRFSNPTEQGIRAQLSGTLRAVQVPGDEHQLLAGTLKDGDRVDLVANLKYKLVNFGKSGGGQTAQDNTATRVVLRDILVLQATETAGLYNTVGFIDDTRAFLSIPARHDVARRLDCAFLAQLVAEHRLDLEEAQEVAPLLAYALTKQAYKL